MKKNIGNIDRIIRVVAGLVIGALGIYYKSWWGIVALVPLVTAAIGYCPLWAMLKVDTLKKDNQPMMNSSDHRDMNGMGGGMQGPQM